MQAVILDMDGVIIDSEPFHYEVFQVFSREELKLHVKDEEYRTYVGMTDVETFSRLREKYGLSQSVPQLVERYVSRFLAYLQAKPDLQPIDGLVEKITEWKASGLKLAVASSSKRIVIETVLQALRIRDAFDSVVSGEEVEHSKPAPDIFLEAARRLNLRPAACMVIEDSANGVRAAKAAGMTCIGFRNPNSGQQDLSPADRIIERYSELSGDWRNE